MKKILGTSLLLFGMVSILMIFAGFTSAYVVSKSRPDWLKDFTLPSAFIWSTVALLISSISFHFALKAIKSGNHKQTSSLLVTTLALGLTFVFLNHDKALDVNIAYSPEIINHNELLLIEQKLKEILLNR